MQNERNPHRRSGGGGSRTEVPAQSGEDTGVKGTEYGGD